MAHHRWVIVWMMAPVGCADLGGVAAPVVYGEDDRREVYATTGVHREIANNAIAVQVDALFLDASDPEVVRITYDGTLRESYDLCDDVAFQEQIDPGSCSGTLIDDRHILTAGHCVETGVDCDGASYPWVFGFSYEGEGALRTLTHDDVYHCSRVVVGRSGRRYDYAVIELDRPVVGRTPAALRTSEPPVGTPLTLIGHPNGIAMKVATGGAIAESDAVAHYADVDAFFGNSGSGIFDGAGELLGILVAGAPDDFTVRPGAGCYELVVLDPSEAEEVLSRADVAITEFCDSGVSSPVCDLGIDTRPPDGGRGGRGCAVSATDDGTGAGLTFALALLALASRRKSKGGHTVSP